MDEGEKGKTTMLLGQFPSLSSYLRGQGSSPRSLPPTETYLDAFILDRIPSEDPTMLPDLVFYLAQHDLFDSVRSSQLPLARGQET